MKISIKTLAALHKRVQAKRSALHQKALELGTALNEAFAGSRIYVTSTDTMLEEAGPDETIYGRLCYDGECLWLNYRTTYSDLVDETQNIHESERLYQSRLLGDCPPNWLDRILSAATLNSFFQSIEDELIEREGQVNLSLDAIDKILAAESAEIEAQMKRILTEQNNDSLTQNWADVLDATHLETADGLTRSSSMLEAVCARILTERGHQLPARKSMSPLIKECLGCLDWPAESEAEIDVRQLAGGVQSICNAIGTLRNHSGTAHGVSSHRPPLDPEFGALAKNACATAIIFLLSRHKRSRATSDDAT